MNHGRLSSSLAASRTLLGCFSVFESLWVIQRIHDPFIRKAPLLVENGNADFKPLKTNLGTGQRTHIRIRALERIDR
jgi:hypothetical protein